MKASCPSFEPHTFSQLITFSRFFTPFGSPNESESVSKTPVVPGDGIQPYSLKPLALKKPCIQSPSISIATLLLMNRSLRMSQAVPR